MIPGDIAYWLSRASIEDLERRKAEEVNRHVHSPALKTSWMLVAAIDEELLKRRRPPLMKDWAYD